MKRVLKTIVMCLTMTAVAPTWAALIPLDYLNTYDQELTLDTTTGL